MAFIHILVDIVENPQPLSIHLSEPHHFQNISQTKQTTFESKFIPLIDVVCITLSYVQIKYGAIWKWLKFTFLKLKRVFYES